MDNNKLVGRTFGQKTTATKDEQGYWKVHVLIEETVTYPDGETKAESIEYECVDKEFDVAHRISLTYALAELGYLVYDRNLNSLIDGKEYERKLEAENDGSENHSDSPIQ